ncbi:GerAB/ArcD/ProY family transporter [Cohnella massiliensis]|uniref:GerAB/ArcD/ProY family transporter n=1 Tax=Cohnella massiliensis TaxID=1816691 RepID=UPI0009B93E90|nr:endospore germination permease [Cohnella massiliensis]
MEKGRISAAQFGILFYSILAYDGLLLIPKITGKEAGRDLWLSPVWAHLVGLIYVIAMLRMARMFPKETVVQYGKRLLGTVGGKAAGAAVIFYCVYLTSVILRIYGDFISAVFLDRTPPLVPAGGIMLLAAYAVRGGVEALGRLAQLFLPVTVLVFGFLIVLTIPEWEVTNVLPIMGQGPLPSVKGALVPTSWFAGYIMLGLYYPLISNQRQAKTYTLLTWFSLMLTLVVSGLVSVFLFGKHAGTLNYPFIEVVRYIAIGEFFQHVDALLLAVWLPGTFLQLATYQYAAVLGTAQWLGIEDYKAIAFPIGFFTLVLSVWGPSSEIDFDRYLGSSHIVFDFAFIAIGLLLCLAAWIRGSVARRPQG